MMERKETLEERIDRINKALEDLLNGITKEPAENAIQELSYFGLTFEEATAWLEHEPNYVPTDDFLQRDKNAKDFTAPEEQI